MTLTITVLRSPEAPAPEPRRIEAGDFTIGRGTENNMVLADPDRHLSKRHCLLSFHAGAWQVSDLSSNGTFHNRDEDPLGQGARRELRDGDRLRLGPYELGIAVAPPRDAGADRTRPTEAALARTARPRSNPFISDDPSVRVPPARAAAPAQLAVTTPARAPVPAGAPAGLAHTQIAPAQAPAPSAGDASLLAAFLAGAGMEKLRPADPERTMRTLGRAIRATVAGLRAALAARSAIKGEFRIDQTMVRARGNNPLKFSADDNDALAAMLGAGRQTDMDASAAIADALRDMRLHELASVAAMQAAVRTLLDQFEPARLRGKADEGGGLAMLPAQRKARAWNAFEKLHEQTTRALADDFDSVFGKAFARAYEKAMREAREQQPPENRPE